MTNLDILLMVTICSGIALCGVYFLVQYEDWRRRQNAEVVTRTRIRLLYQVRLPLPSGNRV